MTRDHFSRGARGLLLPRILLPLLIVALAGTGMWALIRWRRPAPTAPAPVLAPLVRTLEVHMSDETMVVPADGTVQPRTESSLVAEVAGRVLSVSPAFSTGAFFEEGEVLLTIDPADYRQAVAQAEAAVAQAELALAREEADAKMAREDWRAIGDAPGTPLALHELQVDQAEAGLEAARANLARARRDLERTSVRAPFAGRIRQKDADLGQFVARGAPLARIYATDYAEIRLPLPDRELAFLHLPLRYRGETAGPGPGVRVSAEFGGNRYSWVGRIVRTEGEIDPQTRMVYAVARVKDPYGRSGNTRRPPLAVGMFVSAEIQGVVAHQVVRLPRSAMRGKNRVLVVDASHHLHLRQVEVLRSVSDRVFVRSGLEEGEQVCLTPLATVVDGMSVRTAADEPAGETP